METIHAAQRLVKQGARVVIGNGRVTKVWHDRWIGSKPTQMVSAMRLDGGGARAQLTDDMTVSELLSANSREWNHESLESFFPGGDKEKNRSGSSCWEEHCRYILLGLYKNRSLHSEVSLLGSEECD